ARCGRRTGRSILRQKDGARVMKRAILRAVRRRRPGWAAPLLLLLGDVACVDHFVLAHHHDAAPSSAGDAGSGGIELITNGGFEYGIDGWNWSGNINTTI